MSINQAVATARSRLMDAIDCLRLRANGRADADGALRWLEQLAEEWPEDAQLVRPGDLIDTKGAAELLELDRTTVSRWKADGYLPEPFQTTASGPLWIRADLERFAAQHRAEADAAGRRRVGTR